MFIVEHIDGGKRVIGSDGLPASIDSVSLPSGIKVADSRHIQMTVKSIGRIAPFYEATIPLKESTT